MIIGLVDVLVVSAYFLLVFFQFVSVYFAISYFSVDFRTRLLFGISSPFIFIILGLPFKVLGRLDLFAIFQLVIFFIVFFNLLIKKNKKLKIINFRKYFPFLFIILFILHFLSFEARTNYSYAFRDMTNSHMLIKSIVFENAWGYQAGLAIYLSPIYKILDPAGSLDYLGFAIGLVLFMYLCALLEIVKKYLSLYFITIFTLPFFVQNQNYLIGLSNNQFFILYIPLIIYLIYKLKDRNKESKFHLILLSIILSGLSITNPAVSFYIGYVLVIFLIALPTIFKYSFKRISFILFAYLLSITLYFFDRGMKPDETLDFLAENTFKDDTTNLTSNLTTNLTPNNRLLLLQDIFKIKFLTSPFDSYFTASAFLAIFMILAICIYSLKIKNLFYFLFSSAGFIFGLSTLTGIGQYSFIIGRVGWYYILIFLILVSSIILSLVNKYNLHFYILVVGTLIIIFNSLHPPVNYRFDNEEIHIKISNLAKESKSALYLFSTLYDNRIYHFKKDVALINDPQAGLGQTPYKDFIRYLNNCKIQTCGTTIVLIDKSSKLPDPVLSRAISKELINNEQTLKSFYEVRNKTLETNLDLERKLIQEDFFIYYNDENNSILIKY
jgi:hypothetical protein